MASRWQIVDLWKHYLIPRVPGVYVFIKGGRVVYVGQSRDLFDRVYSYRATRPHWWNLYDPFVGLR